MFVEYCRDGRFLTRGWFIDEVRWWFKGCREKSIVTTRRYCVQRINFILRCNCSEVVYRPSTSTCTQLIVMMMMIWMTMIGWLKSIRFLCSATIKQHDRRRNMKYKLVVVTHCLPILFNHAFRYNCRVLIMKSVRMHCICAIISFEKHTLQHEKTLRDGYYSFGLVIVMSILLYWFLIISIWYAFFLCAL